ncbi:hypothetical protein [Streptomyces sp. 1222.5]|uniref:hypothetical protein n=1 Tax=Streptomyces sp. 1222.5 TaxID=1881026 RepID=UPI003D71D3F5
MADQKQPVEGPRRWRKRVGGTCQRIPCQAYYAERTKGMALHTFKVLTSHIRDGFAIYLSEKDTVRNGDWLFSPGESEVLLPVAPNKEPSSIAGSAHDFTIEAHGILKWTEATVVYVRAPQAGSPLMQSSEEMKKWKVDLRVSPFGRYSHRINDETPIKGNRVVLV